MLYNIKKHIFALSIVCVFLFTAVFLLQPVAFATQGSSSSSSSQSESEEDVKDEPDGSAENPYIIDTPEDFDLIRQFPDAHFDITDHIDMDGIDFEPIEQPFTGTLDGGGYYISNLTIEADAAALFYHIENGGENEIGIVKNIAFDNVSIKGEVAAAAVACINEGYVSNIKVASGEIISQERAGGLVARLSGEHATVQKSGNMASVIGETAGGLVGLVEGGTIKNSFVNAQVASILQNDEGNTDVDDEDIQPIGAVFGNMTADEDEFTAVDVIYMASDVETAVPGVQTVVNLFVSSLKPYEAEGFVAMSLNGDLALETGDTGETLVELSGEIVNDSVITYASSDSDLLEVDSETGEYEAIYAGDVEYYVFVMPGDYLYKNIRSYTLSIDVTMTGEEKPVDPPADSSTSDSSTSDSSTSDSSTSDSSTSDSSASDSSTSDSSTSDSSTSDSSTSDSSTSDSSTSDSSTSDSSTSDSSTSDSSTSDSSTSDSSTSDSSTSDSSTSDSSTSDSSTSDSSTSDSSTSDSSTSDEDDSDEPEQVEKGTWVIDGSKRSYTFPDGTIATGPQTIDNVMYIFNDDGEVLRYDFVHGGNWYLAGADGALYTNGFLKRTDSITFYDVDGGAKTGWFTGPDGNEYYQMIGETTAVHQLATGVKVVDGNTYLFSEGGSKKTGTGWFDGVYLIDGVVATGKHVIDGKTYIIGTSGLPMTGEFAYEGANYFAGEDGIVYIDRVRTLDDGTLRYYDLDGQVPTGWIDSGEDRYYQLAGNILAVGRQEIDGTTYFFGSDGKLTQDDGWAGDYYVVDGAAVVGMQNIDENTYYFDDSGLLVRGVFTFENSKYHADENGVLVKNAIAYNAEGTGAYYDADGKAVGAGFIDFDGSRYYQTSENILAVGKHVINNEIYFFASDGKQQTGTGWADEYYLLNGVAVTGVQQIDGNTYIFNTDGVVQKGAFINEGKSYFADETGKVYKNYVRQLESGALVFYGADGSAPLGWFDFDDNKYYQKTDTTLATGKNTIDGEYYFFNSDGTLIKSGWLDEMYIQDGQYLTGYQTIDGKSYIFSDLGIPFKHVFTFMGERYSADGKGALNKNSFLVVSGVTTYYDATGKAPIGWIELTNGDKYYQNSSYAILTGPQDVDGTLYFFGSDGKLVTQDGWAGDYYVIDGKALVSMQEIDGETYFFDDSGLLVRGKFSHDGANYCSDENGVLYKNAVAYDENGVGTYYAQDGKVGGAGWIDLDGNRYYQKSDLTVATGKYTVDTEIYFFDDKGALVTQDGWADDYYLSGGKAVTGRHTIDGKLYIFNSEGVVQKGDFMYEDAWYRADDTGALLTLQIVALTDDDMRYFSETGAATYGFITLGENTYYQNENAFIVTGKQQIDGQTYYFNEKGEQQTGTGWVDGYYIEDGAPVTGLKTIDGKMYIFDDTGAVKKGEFTYNGKVYAADNNGVLYVDAVYTRSDGTKVYFAKDAAAPTGWAQSANGSKYYQTATNGVYALSVGFTEIDASTYYFDSNGKLFAGNASGYYTIGGKTYYIMSDGKYCEPPSIQSVSTLYDKAKDLYSVTINSKVSTASGLHASGSYSFDGGITWQSSNVITVSGKVGVDLAVGKIKVRDAVGQSVQYASAVYLAPVVTTPTTEANSGPGSYGIDVSKHNSYVDWTAVAASGIDFAIIRASSATNAGYYIDPYLEQNVRGAKAAGLDVGLYIYSYANDMGDAKDEIDFFVNSTEMKNLKADGIVLDYPVYVDFEDSINLNGTTYQSRTEIVRYMMNLLEQSGYYPGFYTYHYYTYNFDVEQLVNEGYTFWYARYPTYPNPSVNPSSDLGYQVDIWQYASEGNASDKPYLLPYVNGVRTEVDLNMVYTDLPSKVHAFYGVSSGSTTTPTGPTGDVSVEMLTVYDLTTNREVTDTAANIIAQVVQTEVGGFNNTEVYKAQAVAAHSYILYVSQYGSTPNVMLTPNPSSSVTSAVNSVLSEIVTYNGIVANTMYGSANSGKTQSTQAMWGATLPYLQAGIDSPGDLSATAYVSGGTSWQNRSTTVKLSTTIDNIEDLVPGSTAGRTDYQNWITNPEYDSNGYLTYITVMGQRIRAGKFYDNFWGLYSPNFTMTYNGNGTWTFVTKGNGHCVGMSQWGAYGFAKDGWSYSQILAHYYPGTQINNLY